jgi:hypothetical protein
MTCDLCTEPAVIHLCEVHNGVGTDKHLCIKHGQQSGLHIPATSGSAQLFVNGIACASPEEAAARGVLDNLRGTRNFLRRYGRMPSTVNELREGMPLPNSGPCAQIDDAELLRELRRLDAMVQFIEVNHRLPTTKESKTLFLE